MSKIRTRIKDLPTRRVWLFYGQPYGGAPYGQFSNRSFFFPILVSFLSFSDFKKFFQEKIFEKKNSKFFLEQKELFSRKKIESRKFFKEKI